MNKTELIDAIAAEAGLTKADAKKAVEAFFSSVEKSLKQGKKVARKGWNGKGIFLFLVEVSKFIANCEPLLSIFDEGEEIDCCPHIDMKTADDKIVPWLASQTDVLATDWVLGG